MESAEEEEVRKKLAEFVAADETCEDLLARLAGTQVEVRTSLPFLDAGARERAAGGRRLGRLRVRAGQVLEICGTNDTCKTECLLQAAATCVLPKACGGCSSNVVFLEMKGGVDPLRLVQILDTRIRQTQKSAGSRLLEESLRRFELVRCYNNLDLVCALKVLSAREEGERGQGSEGGDGNTPCRLLLIDDISAFYWIDKSFDASQSATQTSFGGLSSSRKEDKVLRTVSYNLQSVYEAIALNLKKVAESLGSAVIVTRNLHLPPQKGGLPEKLNLGATLPKAWQDIVHYRVVLQRPDAKENAFCAVWDTPKRPGEVVRFAVKDHILEALA
ncbi:XRCC2-like DNA repair protein [Chloropicon primus]|uniref:XRCC2-like DNA repair protein n=1 Tax=Chloropicon primus TaxID=1764295 RepID=A0A5B8MK42_9CHLO|nr:XRCC2-like DNA repair protein [Chloropicon primus]UPR00035.1 XRCC2-like DNA repair protein [Chloropicon primus]|eukprot:QDZ20823.1 XRCC2-like DNA repair protein [Chloropicon primus]